MKDSLLTTQFRYVAIATVAGLLAGCSGGGGSAPQLSSANAGAPVQSVAQMPVEPAYPDYVASLDAVPVSPDVVCKSSAKPSMKKIGLPAKGGTVTIPKYISFTGGATVPASSPAGTMVTLKDSTNNFDSATIPTGQKGVFFTSLLLSQTVQFASGTLTSNVKSGCLIDGATYSVNVYALGGPIQNQSNVKAVNHEIKFKVTVPFGGQFPGGVTADIVISK